MLTEVIRNCLFFLICWRLTDSQVVNYSEHWAYPPPSEDKTRDNTGISDPSRSVTQCDCYPSNNEFHQWLEATLRLLNTFESTFVREKHNF